jgi:hypothetical protein
MRPYRLACAARVFARAHFPSLAVLCLSLGRSSLAALGTGAWPGAGVMGNIVTETLWCVMHASAANAACALTQVALCLRSFFAAVIYPTHASLKAIQSGSRDEGLQARLQKQKMRVLLADAARR